MLHNEVSDGMVGQLGQMVVKISVINLLPKLGCNNVKNLFNHVTAYFIGEKNRNSVVARNKRRRDVTAVKKMNNKERRMEIYIDDSIIILFPL